MGEKKRLAKIGVSESEPSYLELQAHMGTTKHMGGLDATGELVELCHISKDTYVLDVGCGAGATACYLAKNYGCRVVGADVSEKMIHWANKRARREGVEDRVEFRVADARDLPFEDAVFDVVICESVTTFIEDKRRAVSEYVRVTKPGGYIGLNEETWLKTPPPIELVEYISRTWGNAKAETPDCWKELLAGSGARDIVVKVYSFSVQREATQIRRYGFQDYLGMLYRSLFLYIKSSAFRRYMKARGPLPKNIWEYYGYGLYVGRK